jgi:SAM-dependent methyltransferase
VSELQHPDARPFEQVADLYERVRPSYPEEAVHWLVERLGIDGHSTVLDLGAGTGKLARPLVAAGLDVVAVEPMERMRAALATVGAARVLDGRAEAIPLGDASLDGAVCGEAFHWFDGPRAAAELHRVLRPGAGLVLSWLENQTNGQPQWGEEIVALLRPLWERAHHPGIVAGRRGEAVAEHPGFAPVRRVELFFDDEVDRDGLLAWFASFSVVGALPDAERTDMLARMAAILDRHGVERATRSWRANLWVTRRS